jgi:hypothetical protein
MRKTSKRILMLYNQKKPARMRIECKNKIVKLPSSINHNSSRSDDWSSKEKQIENKSM